MDANTLAHFVRRQLFKKNMKVADAVRKSQIGAYTFHTIVQGKAKNPRIKTLKEVAVALELSLIDLLLQSEGIKIDPEISRVNKKFQDKDWHSKMYVESANALGQVLRSKNLILKHQHAIELIDEIYDFHNKFNKEDIDFTFVNWLTNKYIEEVTLNDKNSGQNRSNNPI